MAGGEVDGKVLREIPQSPRHIRVVLAAAAMDHDWLNPEARYGHALCAAEAVVNLQNKQDFPLIFYPMRRPFSMGALAIKGFTSGDRQQLGDLNQKVANIDVTSLVHFGHIWGFYYREPQIAAAIRHYVYFDEMQSADNR